MKFRRASKDQEALMLEYCIVTIEKLMLPTYKSYRISEIGD